ncbi:MAG: signal peptidase I [Alistipes senegalensis]|nr:signal peptidase I [Oxalobacter formigenes]MCM1281412.1 signal peptidase I [Alistipes senegalensis]
MSFQSILSNFALILFVLMVATGIIWFWDVFYLAKKRRQAADAALAAWDAKQEKLRLEGVVPDENGRDEIKERLIKRPVWIEYSGSFFPVIAAVFFLRSFLYEPFKIPSSSMLPTLEVGDLILVNKYTYGIRLPVINKKVFSFNDPQRGDMVVFKYPKDPSLDYIKRVVGIGGDRVVYKDKKLTVNGKAARYQPLPDYLDQERLSYARQFMETLAPIEHRILNDDNVPPYVLNPDAFPYRDLCSYNAEGFACTVPKGYYFMMGDNRDNSLDSRYWGFVPDEYIVGKAFFVWMNLGNMKRIGSVR